VSAPNKSLKPGGQKQSEAALLPARLADSLARWSLYDFTSDLPIHLRIARMPKPKQRKRKDDEFRDQFLRSLKSLDRNLESYKRGDVDVWQDISTQLFILLCDRVPISLAERLIRNLSLHPLLTDVSKSKQNYLLIDAVRKRFTPDGVEFELFDLSQPRIPLGDWLQQTLLYVREDASKDILDNLPWVPDGTGGMFMVKEVPEHLRGEPTDVTLGLLISEARNQMGGGHFTPTIRAIMQATESVVIREKGNIQPFHVKCLVAIAEYVAAELRRQWTGLKRETPV
jgi:hypothetical protein